MRKFSLFTVAATLVAFTSCSQVDSQDVVDTDQPVEIKVAGKALSITPTTRKPFEGIATTDLNARVLASNTSKTYNNSPIDLIKDGTMTFTAATSSTASGFDGGGVPYPHATNSVYLVGLYPTAPSADWTIASDGKSASHTFDGTHDVMATREITTVRSDGKDGYQTLTFHHLLTRLDVIIQAEDQSAIDSWGNVTSIQVKSPSNNITVTFDTEDNNTKPATSFTNAETLFSFYTVGTDVLLPSTTLPLKSSDPSAQSYSIVAPKVGGGSQVVYDLVVTTANHSGYAVSVPLLDTANAEFKGDTKGLKFEITLTFEATDIKAFATVKPWVTGGTGGATIQ